MKPINEQMVKKMNERKTEMDYSEWSQVIDDLKAKISASLLNLEINRMFLASAELKLTHYKKPAKLK